MTTKKNKHLTIFLTVAFIISISPLKSFSEENQAEEKKVVIKKIDLKEVRRLIDAGDSQKALDMMEPFVDEMIGQSKFDYLYGIAAADNGESVKAIFALERVVAQEPDFAAARLELARAMYQNKEIVKAKAEFENILALSPPDDTKELIRNYLDKINNIKPVDTRNWIAQVGLSGGHDSNANFATSEKDFLGFTLSENSIKKASPFTELKGIGLYNLPIDENKDLLFLAKYSSRSNTDAAFANADRIALAATILHKLESSKFNYGINYDNTQINKSTSSITTALNVSLTFSDVLGNLDSSSFYARFAQERYAISKNQDINQTIFGYKSINGFFGSQNTSWFWSIVLGMDKGVTRDSTNAKKFLGARTGFIVGHKSDFKIGGNIETRASHYDAKTFGVDRVDAGLSLDLTTTYKLTKNWTINSSLGLSGNASTIIVNNYDKTTFMLETVWTY